MIANLTRRQFVATATATLAAGCSRGGAPESHDVIVVGAGLSGLYAAMLLQEQGVDAVVLEARERVGGRLWTLDTVPGTPEAGGRTIDAMYARTLDLMSRLGLETFERRPGIAGNALYVGGQLFSETDWPGSPVNTLLGEEHDVSPRLLYDHFIDKMNPLKELLDWRDPQFYPYDAYSIRQAMIDHGVSSTAVEYMEVNFDGTAMADMSALFAYRKKLVALFGQQKAMQINGGSSRLPEAMARMLKTEIRFGKIVDGIRNEPDGVDIQCRDGTVFRGKHALISIPFSVLRDVRLDPEPPPLQRDAINTLPYNHISHVHLEFTSPFWEEDGLPPALWADSPIERILVTPGFDNELHTLTCWLNGSGAVKADGMTRDEIDEFYPAELARLRPVSQGKVKVVAFDSWGNDPFARGSYHFWAPGQIARFGDVIRKPWGRVYWIGEHMAEFQQGMEGALESAERETLNLLETL